MSSFQSGCLHDGRLVGISYGPKKDITLTFREVNDRIVTIRLRQVIRFLATNLLDGNIVFSVRSTKFDHLSLATIHEIAQRAFQDEFVTVSTSEESKTNLAWEAWFRQLGDGSLHLLAVDSSYGAEVVALCSDIEVQDGSI